MTKIPPTSSAMDKTISNTKLLFFFLSHRTPFFFSFPFLISHGKPEPELRAAPPRAIVVVAVVVAAEPEEEARRGRRQRSRECRRRISSDLAAGSYARHTCASWDPRFRFLRRRAGSRVGETRHPRPVGACEERYWNGNGKDEWN